LCFIIASSGESSNGEGDDKDTSYRKVAVADRQAIVYALPIVNARTEKGIEKQVTGEWI
jgi:hypothetical protein